MGKVISFRQKEVAGPPKGEAFVWQTVEMKQSPAFRKMSMACRAFIDYLEIQHMQHAGTQNGRLTATYTDLAKWGINKNWIKRVIAEAVKRKLVEVTDHESYRGYGKTSCTLYRLTYLPTCTFDKFNRVEWIQPTNDWKFYKPRQRLLPLP